MYSVKLISFRKPEESRFLFRKEGEISEETDKYLYEFDERTGNILIVRKCDKCNEWKEMHDYKCTSYDMDAEDIVINHDKLTCDKCRKVSIYK